MIKDLDELTQAPR